MARYAEWNKFIGNLKTDKYGATNVNEVGIAFDKAIADVVPKSEVERWRRNLEAVLEEIPETKREIAREICEEIESLFFKNGVFIHIQSYNELKKKYTEGEK